MSVIIRTELTNKFGGEEDKTFNAETINDCSQQFPAKSRCFRLKTFMWRYAYKFLSRPI